MNMETYDGNTSRSGNWLDRTAVQSHLVMHTDVILDISFGCYSSYQMKIQGRRPAYSRVLYIDPCASIPWCHACFA